MLIKGAIYRNKETKRLERVKYVLDGEQFARTISPQNEGTDGKEEVVESEWLEKVGQFEVGQFVDAKRYAAAAYVAPLPSR